MPVSWLNSQALNRGCIEVFNSYYQLILCFLFAVRFASGVLEADARASRGLIYFAEGRAEDGLAELTVAVRLDPGFGEVRRLVFGWSAAI